MLTDIDLTPEAIALLRAGAENSHGFCCLPGQVAKNWVHLRDAERAGYVRLLQMRPWITDAGRRAISAPSESEASRARLIELCGQRKRLKPERRADPRTDFDYRSYKEMGWICTLVIRQLDSRENPPTIRVGRTLTSEAQYLGSKNSIVQPESEGRFVLTLVPSWMVGVIVRDGRTTPPIFSSYPLALDETDDSFTDDERAVWDRLRLVCISINSRINSAGRKAPERHVFGENA